MRLFVIVFVTVCVPASVGQGAFVCDFVCDRLCSGCVSVIGYRPIHQVNSAVQLGCQKQIK